MSEDKFNQLVEINNILNELDKKFDLYVGDKKTEWKDKLKKIRKFING